MTTFAPQVPLQSRSAAPSSPEPHPETLPAPAAPVEVVRSWRRGSGHGHGVGPELLRGKLPDGRDVRVTLPLERVAAVEVQLRPLRAGGELSVQMLEGGGGGLLEESVAAGCSALGLESYELRLRVRSRVGGTGQGSSSAEAAAGLRAIASACERPLSDAVIAGIVAEAAHRLGRESSHSAWAGITAVDAQDGSLVREWSWGPRYALVLCSPHTPPAALVELAPSEVAGVLDELAAASAVSDSARFAAAATRAASAHPAPSELLTACLEALPSLAREGAGPLGVAWSPRSGSAALLYPAEGQGRNLASRASHLLSAHVREHARVSCTLSRPRSR